LQHHNEAPEYLPPLPLRRHYVVVDTKLRGRRAAVWVGVDETVAPILCYTTCNGSGVHGGLGNVGDEVEGV